MTPFLACNMVLGTQTLVSHGQERPLTRVLFLAGIASLPLVALLGWGFDLPGVAAMPLLVEAGIFAGLAISIRRHCPEALFPISTTS
jgi:polysaccharide transporter, PST family